MEKQGPSPLSAIESGRLDEVLVGVEREVYLDSERQWLGVVNPQDYVLGAVTREKSEGFEDQVARELYRRGYTLRGKVVSVLPTLDTKLTSAAEASKHNKGRSASQEVDVGQGHLRGGSHRRSWWQTIYQRVSQSGGDNEQEAHLSPHPKRKSVSRPKDCTQALLPLIQETPPGGGNIYDDPPPPSMLDAYHSNQFTDNQQNITRDPHPPASPSPPNFVQQPVNPDINPRVQLGRSDSLLDRVFTYLDSDAHATNTDLDHGTNSQPSRPASLWGAGSPKVIPKHNEQRLNVTEANISDGIYPQPVSPVRGNVIGEDGAPSRHEELATTPPKGSHIREVANHSAPPPHLPLMQPSTPVPGGFPAPDDPPANLLHNFQPPGIPEPSADYERSFPLHPPHVDLDSQIHAPEQVGYPRAVRPSTMPHTRPHPPRQHPIAGPSSPPEMARSRPATRKEALLRPFPEPVHHLPPNVGPARFTPPRSKLKVPTPLAQPPPPGSGSLKKNKNSLPPPEQRNFAGGGPYRKPPNRSRTHSQSVPVHHHAVGPNYVKHPSNPSPRDPHRITSQPLPILQEASHPDMSLPSGPLHRSSRRLSSPPLSALPLDRPSRSNAIHRKSQSPGSCSPTQAMSPRVSLLAELRGAQPPGSTDFTRYPHPAIGPGSGIGSPRNSRLSVPPSPRTPTFVNTHMLPPSSPRSDVEEWASAVSSFSPSMRRP